MEIASEDAQQLMQIGANQIMQKYSQATVVEFKTNSDPAARGALLRVYHSVTGQLLSEEMMLQLIKQADMENAKAQAVDNSGGHDPAKTNAAGSAEGRNVEKAEQVAKSDNPAPDVSSDPSA